MKRLEKTSAKQLMLLRKPGAYATGSAESRDGYKKYPLARVYLDVPVLTALQLLDQMKQE